MYVLATSKELNYKLPLKPILHFICTDSVIDASFTVNIFVH